MSSIQSAVIVLISLFGTRGPGGTEAARQLKAGDPAPRFAGKTTSGKTIRLSSLRGKVVVLDFWTTT